MWLQAAAASSPTGLWCVFAARFRSPQYSSGAAPPHEEEIAQQRLQRALTACAHLEDMTQDTTTCDDGLEISWMAAVTARSYLFKRKQL
jgi:hypothetical protein